MNDFKTYLQKIEQPLNFARRDNFRNLPNIKELGKSLTKLILQFKSSLPDIYSKELSHNFRELEDIFSIYDSQKGEEKKSSILKAISAVETIRKELNSLLVECPSPNHSPRQEETISDLKSSQEKLLMPVQFLKGVGPKMSARLATKKIKTIDDLLHFLPRTYEDRREIQKINKLEAGKVQTVKAKVIRAELLRLGRKKILKVEATDNTAVLTAKWFKGRLSYFLGAFEEGTSVIFTGNVFINYKEKVMIHPDYEILEDTERENLLNFKRIVPIYSETEGLHQKYIRKVMYNALGQYSRYVFSPIPRSICQKRGLIDIHEALNSVHFPENNELPQSLIAAKSAAHRRLIYDEFFFFQLGMAIKKSGRLLDQGIAFYTEGSLLSKFHSFLPFDLTRAQKRVINEIHNDLRSPVAMNRLLQGDVGSGKTLVAMSAMITVCENNYQAALMAPTEILANQHFATISKWANYLGLQVVLLAGGLANSPRNEVLEKIRTGEANIIIGTHALIQESVDFKKLGFVVIDEQHRFGVVQRANLRSKGINADMLVMTATPIPRTLAMTVYGDLDVSVIDEMPPNKKPVQTFLMSESKRRSVYSMIESELSKGNQVFIVYPLIEQSEKLDLKDASNMAKHLQEDVFPSHRVGLIHGKMKEREKNEVMREFQENQISILVSTTVVEVGIDVPRASLMIIEHAERFGLSQLHQLRGRVGRRDIPSKCILIVDHKVSADARKRLKVMENTTDGFLLAEADMAIRGPGDILGTRQSGLPDFRIASIIRDAQILNEAKEDAFEIVAVDPLLERPEHSLLKEVLISRWQGKLEMARTG